MRSLVCILFFLNYSVVSAQNLQYALSFSGGPNLPLQTAIDNFGNIYTVGLIRDTVDFDPSSLVYNLTSNGQYDLYISKLDAQGNFLWAKPFGTATNESLISIDIDDNSNIYLTGIFQGLVDFDTGPGVSNLLAGYADIFIVKYDSQGNLIWAKSMGGPGYDYGRHIRIDKSGNVILNGRFVGMADLNPGSGVTNLSWVHGQNFIEKLDENGNLLWVKQFGSEAYLEDIFDLEIDYNGNIYLAGGYDSIANFSTDTTVDHYLSSNGLPDGYVLKLDSSGNFVWVNDIESIGHNQVLDIAIDTNGNVVATGHFQGTVDFDPSNNIHNLTATNALGVFVVI